MRIENLGEVLKLITENSNIVGFTVAEYLLLMNINCIKCFLK
jgi:hypothetical protein